jgi:rRNA maturation endonuclease Nob1
MPLWHCTGCHHEWEGSRISKCDWCGHDGYVLRTKTDLERMLDSEFLDEILDAYGESGDSK